MTTIVSLLRRHTLLAGVVLLFGCGTTGQTGNRSAWTSNVEMFEAELQDLQAALAIPGLAYVIVTDSGTVASGAFGVAQAPDRRPFTTSTPLRIASVTKSVTAVIALQLVEEGKLDLDAPARQYAPGLSLPADVLVRHLLTHTSEGVIGAEYVYSSSRYAMLGQVIEAVAGTGFDTVVRERVLDRAAMQSYVSPDLGAHAALVSTVDDIGTYMTALERGALLQPEGLARLAVPSRTPAGAALPVSVGWFVQTVQGQTVMWGFGQDDPEHSGALLVRLPGRKLSLFILANSNVLSDPFRLLMGDVTKSPFAMSFVRLFAFSPPGTPLSRPARADSAIADALAVRESSSTYRYRDELVGWALVDLWTNDLANATQKIDLARSRYRDTVPDPVLHFATMRLQEPAARERAIREGEHLLREHPNNRWILLAQGYLLQQHGRVSEGTEVFHRILNLPNQEPDFLRRLFRAWSWMALAQMTAQHNPAEARAYLQRIVQSGVTDEVLTETQRMLESLDQRRAP
jgi:CubicO group peptidase (beta-lactamase class C family)